MSSRPKVTLRLLQGEAIEMAELQRVLEAAPTYAHLITGAPPGHADAQRMYSILPPGKGYEDKFVFGIYLEGHMVGGADLIRGYPDSHTAHLGLLLIAEPFQGKGIGKAAYAAVEDYVRCCGVKCTKMRLGVLGTNARVLPFWAKLGFVRTGDIKPYRYANVISETIILMKALDAAA